MFYKLRECVSFPFWCHLFMSVSLQYDPNELGLYDLKEGHTTLSPDGTDLACMTLLNISLKRVVWQPMPTGCRCLMSTATAGLVN